jgi:hypothetical protein
LALKKARGPKKPKKSFLTDQKAISKIKKISSKVKKKVEGEKTRLKSFENASKTGGKTGRKL